MKYDTIVNKIQRDCKPVKRGGYIYNIMPHVVDTNGNSDGNALYRADAWDAAHSYYIDWQYLRCI
jgi:ribosomal protein L36